MAMKEKTVKSPGEQGEYLIYEDVMGERDFGRWKTFMTWEEAEAAVEAEAGRSAE